MKKQLFALCVMASLSGLHAADLQKKPKNKKRTLAIMGAHGNMLNTNLHSVALASSKPEPITRSNKNSDKPLKLNILKK